MSSSGSPFWEQIRFSLGPLVYPVGTAVSQIDARIGLPIYAGLTSYSVAEPLMAARLPTNPRLKQGG